MSAPRTARDRVRTEVTHEILEVAGIHLAREGAAALSLRSIARDLEMAPSALYRYFDGRDALLSALILRAYTSLADAAEGASESARASADTDGERWMAVPRAMRRWAIDRPHEWGLIFGTPIPGYRAPEDTVVPYARMAVALARPVAEALRADRLEEGTPVDRPSDALRAALAPVAEGILPGAPTVVVTRALQAWTTLIGLISLELFGHWHNTVLDPELFFDDTVRQCGRAIGLRL